MILLFIFLALVIMASILGAISDGFDGFGSALFLSGMGLGLIFMLVNIVGIVVNTHSKEVVYTQSIVSINDGTGVKGSMSGNLFVIRGQVGDTQHFSYYIDNGNGSYSLTKRDATRSTIYPDATAQTASVVITDRHKTCEPTWWSILCSTDEVIFEHADFHVPGDSIKNDFVLDAE